MICILIHFTFCKYTVPHEFIYLFIFESRFQGLGVKHVTKKKVGNILYNRMLQANLFHNQMLNKDFEAPSDLLMGEFILINIT